MIEVEERCNLDCSFCFNKNTFAKEGRNINNKLSNEYVKKIIDDAVDSGLFALRFTGGEPLMREDIWDLAEYAVKKNVKLCLNTNGLLIGSIHIAERISSMFENVLISLQYKDFVGINPSARQKIKAIKLLKKTGTQILRIGSVATFDLINNLEKFHEIIYSLNVDDWELYRELSFEMKRTVSSFSRKSVKKLVNKLLKINIEFGKTYKIANALPFCSYDPAIVSQVCLGAEAVDGHIRFAIDPRGFAKPFYYFEENIGNPLDLKSCWNSDFMIKMRNLEFTPRECKDCIFLEKCKGGCRFSAKITYGSYDSPDPLMHKK
ncbi:MAG: radical SAM protein [Candidatus Gastranaerophilaceae bacterium]